MICLFLFCHQVVCFFCSDYQAPLKYLHNKPHRVCKTCYNKLKKGACTSWAACLSPFKCLHINYMY